MLKYTPRLITLGLILAFAFPIAIEHFIYAELDRSGVDRPPPKNEVDDNRALHWEIGRRMALFNWLERVDYDLHLTASSAGPISEHVAVVEIGEPSLKKLGQFPFIRTVYGPFIKKLEDAGAKVVAFDVTFPEHDSHQDIVDDLRKLRHEVMQVEGFDSKTAVQLDQSIFKFDGDEAFTNALSSAKIPVVIGFTLSGSPGSSADFETGAKLLLPFSMSRQNYPDLSSLSTYTGKSPVVSIEKIMQSLNKVSSVGHINPEINDDSVIRTVPAVMEFEQQVYGSLALRAVAAYYGEKPVINGDTGLMIKGITIDKNGESVPGAMQYPLNVDGTFRLRYYGGPHTFPYYEFSDIYDGSLSGEALKKAVGGKIIFVGATAAGLKDIRAMPFSTNYPGVEAHATFASNVLQRSFLLRDQRFFLYGYLFLFVFSVLTSWAVYRFHPLVSFAVMAASVCGTQFAAWLCFNEGVIVPSLLPSASVISVFFSGVLYRYFTEEREKKVVRAAFSRYVSGAVVDEILRDHTKLRLGGQKKEVTIMFVDLVEFTKLTERLDATFVTQLLNEYFTRMTKILLLNKGTLDKYMGDGLMCFWGAPLEIPDHAHLACVTALEMRAELSCINEEWKTKHGISIRARIGVHTGVVSVGNMGSDQVFSYTVMGDNVNLGSRLEGVNTVYGTEIVVSAATAGKAGSGFLFRPLDHVQVKGREDPVEILELVSPRLEREPDWIYAFRAGLGHYRAGEWDDAEGAFGACLSLKPNDGPSQVFLDRIRDFRIVEPEDWRGVWRLSSK